MIVDERWNKRNRGNGGNGMPGFETPTVPVKGMTDNKGNAVAPDDVNWGQQGGTDVGTQQGGTDTGPQQGGTDTGIQQGGGMSALETSNELMRLFNYVSPEEQAKRERAANAIAGIGNLGNVLNSFSNLIFTNGGAPNMQLPKAPDGNLQDFQDRILNNRMKYLSYLDAKEKMKEANDLKRRELDYKMKKDVEDRALELMKLNGNLSLGEARIQAQRDIAAERTKEQARHNKAQEAIGWKNADTASRNQDKVVDSALGDDGNIYTRNTRMTTNEAMQIVQSSGLNGEDLEEFTTGVKLDTYDKPVPGSGKVDWMAAAAYALQNGMVPAEELKSRGFKLGGGSSSPSAKSPNESSGKASGNNTAPYKRNNNNENKAPYIK